MTFNMASLSQTFAQHRTPILVGGAGVVSAAGLYAHHKNTQAAAAGTAATTTSAAAASPVTGGAVVAGTDPYSGGSVDTTGTDVYNALQPQLAQQQNLLAQLLDALKNGIPTPAKPKPTPKPKPKPPPHHVITPPLHKQKPAPRKPPKGPTHKTHTRHVYVVQRGDSLSKIAARFHTTWPHLYAVNRAAIGRNPNLIRPGQHLVIP